MSGERLLELRLALPLVGLWLGIGVGFAVAREPLWLLPLALALAVSLWLLRRTRGRFWLLLGCTVLGVVLVSARALLGAAPADLAGTHLLQFRVLEDPKSVSAGFGSLNFERSQRFLADATAVDGVETRAIPVLLTVAGEGWRLSELGECTARLELAEGWLKFRAFARCRGAAVRLAGQSRLEALAAGVRASAVAAVAGLEPSAAAGLLPGLALGDESSLDAVSEAELQAAGLGHLTAVSGANIAILLGALQLLLVRTRLGWRSRIAGQVAAVAMFVVVVRPTPSVVRAAAMALLGLWVVWRGGRRAGGRLLLLASLLLLLLDPWLAVSWGFALSVAATAGLIFLAPLLAPSESPWWRRAVATAAAAGLATLPILLAMDASPTFASIPANVLAELFVAPATVSGVVAALLTAIGDWHWALAVFGWGGRVVAQFGVWAAAGVLWVAQRANDSWLAVPVWSLVGATALACSLVAWWRWRIAGWTVIVLVSGVTLGNALEQRLAPWPPADWQVIGCDVGQGDATLIRAGASSAVVVDAGPDPLALRRCLKSARVDDVPLFIPTHWHADHVGGVLALQEFQVVDVWWPCGVEPAAGQRLVSEVLPQARRLDARTGPPVAGLAITVLSCPEGAAGAADGSSVNNSSLLLSVGLPQGRLLLAADAESELQRELMSSIAPGGFWAVKVPHHGSAAADPAFAAWSGAAWGWISVGAGNDYGHPAPETLAAYRAARVKLMTTEHCGDIALTPIGLVGARECRAV